MAIEPRALYWAVSTEPVQAANIPRMNSIDVGAAGIGLVVGAFALVQLAWHVAVLVLVYRIWRKVKHLPS
jgi:hypothetical protein